ncbi:MAG: DUF58 domain-containing protein [Planctomycetota bacterium]
MSRMASRAFSALMGLPTTTVEGRFFLVGLVALGFLSTATDRNFVLLVLGLLVGVLVVSVIFAGRNLAGIEFRRRLPRAVIAGETFSVHLTLRNRRRFTPIRSVLARDALQSSLTGAESRCFAPTIPAGGRVTFVYNARIRRRGAYNITNALLVTRFPFRLFEKRSLATHPSRIVVYPRMREVAGENLPGSRDRHAALRERAVRRRGGDEFRALRDYRAGDDPRRIAWRVSARQGDLVVREMERENRGRVAVVLATSLAGVPPTERRSALETAVTLAASLVRHFHRERRPLFFAAPGLTARVGSSASDLHRCLEHLATVRADAEGGPAQMIETAGPRRLSGMDVLLIAPGEIRVRSDAAPGCRIHPVSARAPETQRLFRRRGA